MNINVVRQIVSGALGGAMAYGTAIVTVIQDTPVAEVTQGQWWTAAIGGAIAAATAWRTLLALPNR